MEWMILPLKKYARFRGRSQRKEFWMWVLLVLIVAIILSIVDRALGLGGSGTTIGTSQQTTPFSTNSYAGARMSGGPLTALFSLAILIPNLAVSVRRLHDIDRTGWWVVIPIAPYLLGLAFALAGVAQRNGALAIIGGLLVMLGAICGIVLLVFYCLDGTRGPNRFGPDPKGTDLAETFS